MIIPFLLITLGGIFIVQSAVISLALHNFDPLANLVMDIFGLVPAFRNISFNFYETNIAKLFATAASMIWNYIYNLSFDHIMNFVTGTIEKSFQSRLVHALLFEFGLVMLIVPFIAWYLDVTLWQAFLMDIALAGFYLVYALVFNLLYDAIFPAPEWLPLFNTSPFTVMVLPPSANVAPALMVRFPFTAIAPEAVLVLAPEITR